MRLVFLILLIWPIASHAAPVLVAAGMTAATAATVVAVAQVALFVGSIIYGDAQRRKAQRDAEAAERARRDAYNNSLQDRTITTVNAAQPFRYVYGRARVGSAIVAILTSGDRDQFKHLVCVHAAHECDAIEEIYIGGKALGPLDGQGRVTSGDYYKTTSGYYSSGWQNGATFTLPEGADTSSIIVSSRTPSGQSWEGEWLYPPLPFTISGSTVTVTGGQAPFFMECRYTQNASTVRVQKHLGSPTDPVDAYLHSVLPAKWPTTAVLRDFTYTVVTLDLNQPEFQGGIPDIEVLLRGKKLYDVRTGTTAWSQNNALVIYDYLTSEMCGVPASDLPLADFIAAANVCDESTPYGPLYTFNGDVTADQSQQKVLEKMAQSMAGGIVSTTWSIWAGKYVAPVMALQQSDIVGAISITPGVADADLYNGVRGQFIGAETGYVATDFKPYQNETYLDADGEELWSDIDFPYTDSTQRVHNLARIYTEDQRNGFTVKGEFSLKALDLRVGQRVTLTSAFYGWSSKVFRITDKSFSPRSAVTLVLKEDAASIWDLEDAVEVDSTPNTDLPNPFQIGPLESLTCESGTEALLMMSDGTIVSRILVSWPAGADLADQVEIQWKRAGEAEWLQVFGNGDDLSLFLSPAQDGSDYIVRGRTIRASLNVKSDWVYATHTVVGKTAPPSDVTGFTAATDKNIGTTLRWNQVTDVDFGDCEIRDGAWDSGTLVARVKGNSLKLGTVQAANKTYSIKARDTSGNYSENAATVTVTVTAPPAPSLTAVIEGSELVLTCTEVAGTLATAAYDVRYGASFAAGTSLGPLKGTTRRIPISWAGTRQFWAAAIDIAGNVGAAGNATVGITVPSAPVISQQVIDNNVLLRWSDAKKTLPIQDYEMRKGDVFESAEVIGRINARFSVVFESLAGTYKYWVVGIDTAGNYGTPGSTTGSVAQPPDYQLQANIVSDFSGTKSNLAQDVDGSWYGPVDTAETWAEHFSARGWDTIQDQIDAGYPRYAEPGVASGYYEEEIDYGTVLPATRISVTPNYTIDDGSPTISITVSVKKEAGDSWTDYVGVNSVYVNDFRYLKVRLNISGGGTSILRFPADSPLIVRLDVKRITDGGMGAADASDVDGTEVTFNTAFIDVQALTVTPQGSNAAYATYDFVDVPYPSVFKVYLWDKDGNRVSGPFSWNAKGV